MSEIPAGVSIEALWFVQASYAPDGAEARTPFRAEHLAAAARRIAEGAYVEVFAFADVSASCFLVRAESEAAALALVGDDVYLRNGVWVELRAQAVGRVVTPDGERA
jgi:uncharacterized protein YciI